MASNDKTLSVDDGRQRRPEISSHLFLEMECDRPSAGPARYRLAGIRRVRFQRGAERLATVEGDTLIIRVPDRWMSSDHAELRAVESGWQAADLASKNGTVLNSAPIENAPVADGDLLLLGHTFFRFRAGAPAVGAALLEASDMPEGPGGLRTLSPGFAAALARAAAVAEAKVPVLLQGESGSGKEVLARALHALSGRRGPCVAVNCGALPPNLVESELFGHKKGAFSGAEQDSPGLARSADGGTLFLDEIGDLPLHAQVALLRMLQEKEVRPVGAARAVPVDLRVIAATHRDLDAMVEAGEFREDLLARLDGVRLELPPLRERPEDVALLIGVLLRKLAPERPEVRFAPAAAKALLQHHWPTNVRELEQALAGALALAGPGVIELEHLPGAVRESKRAAVPSLSAEKKQHRDELVGLLKTHRGNLSAVARAVGKKRTQVQRWMARYGLDADDYRG